MRSPRLLVLALLALVLGLSVASASAAQSPTLTADPRSGAAGTVVTLTYDMHSDASCQSSSDTQVWFRYDSAQATPFAKVQLQTTCTATAKHTVPVSAPVGAHTFYAVVHFVANNQDYAGSEAATSFLVTPRATKSPLPTLRPSPTRSPTPSPTPSPTASPTPSPTATATPSATPSATAAVLPPQPTRSALPVGTAPGTLPDGGSSGTPWVVVGVLVGLAGLGASLGLLRPRGAGTPVVAGVAVVSVLAGLGLALKPLTDPPTPLVLGTYALQGAECAEGDLPVNGGFHVLDNPPQLLHFEPSGRAWDASPSGTGESYTVCLHLSRTVPWQVRTTTMSGNPPHASVGCQTQEQLLGGGFYVPWGFAGREGTHPEPPARWAGVTGPEPADLPAISATVSALCAELPDGIKTYTVVGSTAVTGTATARCFPGDVVINGGYAGGEVRGSHPVDGGWSAELGFGGGSAYALCVHPSRTLGIRSTYVRQASVTGEYQASADCDSGATALAGGWTSGTGIGGLMHLRPDGDSSWVSVLPQRGDVSAYVLCAKRYT